MIPRHVFREYDIRGLHATELTDDLAESVGRAFGTLIRGEGGRRVALGRDVRPSSERLADAAARGMVAAGLEVERVGVVPTPALYFAVAKRGLDGGMQITGSHNPPEFNGFKMTRGALPVFGADIQAMADTIVRGAYASGPGAVLDEAILDEYRAELIERHRVDGGLEVVMDCGNGCAGTVVPEVFQSMGHNVTALFPELDGRFPNHLPDPTVPGLLVDLQREVKRARADLGIAFDGDADRIGAVDAGGRIVWGDQILALLARDVLQRVPGAEILYDVKCSQGLAEDIAAHGGRPSMWKTGHSLLKQRLQETGAPLAGEMSGHMFFREGWYGFDDALVAAGRLLRYVAGEGRTFAAIVDSIPHYVATPELRLACPEERKFAIVQQLTREFEGATDARRVITLDGVRVEFGDGWGLVRASNTQPVLVARFEARTPERLEQIRHRFMERLKRLGVGELPVGH
ncbi:MAG TPA: phosphomannomutase/phosphoglucomutase [Candidatus Eisenbacteria bacterium]|nr:phosphomannomutase/phosphoglucomutase [Candidatus Eisenbacteria bacterium]